MPDRSYTADEVDAALAALVEPGRLAHAQDIVVHAAPTLQRVLAEALSEGGWFGEAHNAEVSRALAEQDEGERLSAVSTIMAEQTRLGMFVGVAVGFELAHELSRLRGSSGGEAPEGGTHSGGTPEDEAPEGGTHSGGTPEDEAPEGEAPEGGTPEDGSVEDGSHGGVSSDHPTDPQTPTEEH